MRARLSALCMGIALCFTLCCGQATAGLREDVTGTWAIDAEASVTYAIKKAEERGETLTEKDVKKLLRNTSDLKNQTITFAEDTMVFTGWTSGNQRESLIVADEARKKIGVMSSGLIYTLLDSDTMVVTSAKVAEIFIVLRRVK